jgi:hypothetical protein
VPAVTESGRRAALLWLLSLMAQPAHARVMLDFALELEAPPAAGCASPAALQRAVEARIDRLVFLGDPAPARRIQLVVVRDPAAGWSAQITMRDERAAIVGERRVSSAGERCAELDEALIVVLSTLSRPPSQSRLSSPPSVRRGSSPAIPKAR